MTKKPIIIIGAGIGGLTAGAILSRMRMKCIVLEMDARPGGYLAGFRRKDFRFDSAIHWLNQCGEKGFVTHIFSALGSDYPKAKTLTHIRKVISDDFEFELKNNPEEFKKELIKQFPEDKKGIIQFFNEAKKIATVFDQKFFAQRNISTFPFWKIPQQGIKLLNFARYFIPHLRYSGDENLSKGLKKYFSNPKINEYFSSEPDLLSCLIPIAWAYNNDFQSPPKGGGQSYAEWLVHIIQSSGSEVRFKSKVISLNTNKQAVESVSYLDKTNTKHQLSAEYVIAACDLEKMLQDWLPICSKTSKWLKKINEAELYSSAITLSLGLNCPAEELGFSEQMIYISPKHSSRKEHESGGPEKCGIHLLSGSAKDKSLAPKEKGTLTIFAPAFFNDYNEWETLVDENGKRIRGAEYKSKKEEVATILLNRVEKSLSIDLRKHIEYLDIATPITHQRYTHNKDGTMMGARPGKANYQLGVANYKTPYKNLFIGGQWAELGGGVPIAVQAGVNASLLILRQKKHKGFKLLGKLIDKKISPEKFQTHSIMKPYKNDWKQELTPAEKKAKTN